MNAHAMESPLGSLRRPALLTALKGKKAVAMAAALFIAAALIASVLVRTRSSAQPAYATQPVLQRTITQTVTASGTVNAQNMVSVGTQVSGTIASIAVDFNSHVKKGEVLARLDPSQLQAQLAQANAALMQARAQSAASAEAAAGAQSAIEVARSTGNAQDSNAQAAKAAIATADANVLKAQSAASLSAQTIARDRTLLSQGYIAQSQYDIDESNDVAAQSAVQAAQAAAIQARAEAAAAASQAQASAAQTAQSATQAAGSGDSAQASQAAVASAQALVEQDQLNLQRAVITSPVDGTVINRAVSVGETVAASLQTPTLFTIAQNVKNMEVDIAVGEPDIGNVKAGDPVQFTVLAYPNQSFHGVVSQVRENPTTVDNVVTYTAITIVKNPQNQLLPGMTANAAIDVATARNALVVPSQALSFNPGTASPRGGGASQSSPWGATAAGVTPSLSPGSRARIYIERSGRPSPVPVAVVLISGAQAAVTPLNPGSLMSGDRVIIGGSTAQSPRAKASQAAHMGGLGRGL